MKVLLIYPPGKTSFVTPPLGLMYLGTYLEKSGNQPEILDFLLEEFREPKLLEKAAKADLIGISVVTPLLQSAVKIADIIKKNFPEKIVVFGGPHPTLLPEETLQSFKNVDFIVSGEGEERLPQLIDYLEGKIKKDDLDGIYFREKGRIVGVPQKKCALDMDLLLLPARTLVAIKEYSRFLGARKKPATTILTSRGCPFNCVYCSKPVFGNNFRGRPAKDIVREIELLKADYKIKEVIFYDDSFTFNRERIIGLCRLLIDKKINIKWKCETRVNLVDEELLNLMKQAGCYLIGYGIESGSQRILNILKKGITLEQVRKAVELTQKAGIEVLGYFMVGIPSEKEEEIKATINFAKRLNVDYAQFAVATAFPGTELVELARTCGKAPQNWQDAFYALGKGQKIVSLCDFSEKTLRKYLKGAYRSFYLRPGYIFNKIKKIRSFGDLIFYFKGFLSLLGI